MGVSPLLVTPVVVPVVTPGVAPAVPGAAGTAGLEEKPTSSPRLFGTPAAGVGTTLGKTPERKETGAAVGPSAGQFLPASLPSLSAAQAVEAMNRGLERAEKAGEELAHKAAAAVTTTLPSPVQVCIMCMANWFVRACVR